MKKQAFVFVLLLTLVCCTTEADRNRMRAGLDSLNQRNRNYEPLSVAEVHMPNSQECMHRWHKYSMNKDFIGNNWSMAGILPIRKLGDGSE